MRAKWTCVAVALTLVGLASTSAPAVAAPALDANCPGPSDDTDTYSDGINPERVAQTFTAVNTGALVRVEVEVNKSVVTGSDWVLQLVATDSAGVPTNSVLGSASIPDSSVPVGISQLDGVLNPGASVQAGQQYALVLARPGGGSFGVREHSGDPCPGQKFESPSQTGAWSPSSDTAADIVFTTFVEPDCDGDGFGDESQDPSISSCHPRGLTLDANKNKVRKGKRVSLFGQVTELARQAGCQSGQPVDLQRKKPSQSTFTTVEQVQTDAAGAFSAKERVKKTFEYRAQVTETPTCVGQVSNTEKVKVKKN